MTNMLFVKLYDMLSRRLAHDTQCGRAAQSLLLVPGALRGKRAPVLLYEANHKGAVSYVAYYPLNEQAYSTAFPKMSLIRFNMCNIHNNRGRVFGCGLGWWDDTGYLWASLDIPQLPDDPQAVHSDLFAFLDAVASSLELHPAALKLKWTEPGLIEKEGWT